MKGEKCKLSGCPLAGWRTGGLVCTDTEHHNGSTATLNDPINAGEWRPKRSRLSGDVDVEEEGTTTKAGFLFLDHCFRHFGD